MKVSLHVPEANFPFLNAPEAFHRVEDVASERSTSTSHELLWKPVVLDVGEACTIGSLHGSWIRLSVCGNCRLGRVAVHLCSTSRRATKTCRNIFHMMVSHEHNIVDAGICRIQSVNSLSLPIATSVQLVVSPLQTGAVRSHILKNLFASLRRKRILYVGMCIRISMDDAFEQEIHQFIVTSAQLCCNEQLHVGSSFVACSGQTSFNVNVRYVASKLYLDSCRHGIWKTRDFESILCRCPSHERLLVLRCHHVKQLPKYFQGIRVCSLREKTLRSMTIFNHAAYGFLGGRTTILAYSDIPNLFSKTDKDEAVIHSDVDELLLTWSDAKLRTSAITFLERMLIQRFEQKTYFVDTSVVTDIWQPKHLSLLDNFLSSEKRLFSAFFNDEYSRTVRTSVTMKNIVYDRLCDSIKCVVHNARQRYGFERTSQVTWMDVAGHDVAKEVLLEALGKTSRCRPTLQKKYIERRNILLFGPPGTGKTLIAKAMCNESNLTFVSIKGPELLSMYVGESERAIRTAFTKAIANRPALLFLDEVDSLAPIRSKQAATTERITIQMQSAFDDVRQFQDVFILGASNRPDLIDKSLLRKGRFDYLLYIGVDTSIERRVKMLNSLTRKMVLQEEVNLFHLASACNPIFSGADFYDACVRAWIRAAKRLLQASTAAIDDKKYDHSISLTSDDFLVSFKRVKPSLCHKDILHYETLAHEYSTRGFDLNTERHRQCVT